MNVLNNKLLILFCLCSFICVSQTKNDDAYFFLNKSQKKYILKTAGKYIDDNTNFKKINSFYLYDKKLYEERKKQIEKEKKEGDYFPILHSNVLPKTMLFRVVSNKREIIKHCDAHLGNIVDLKWIQDNSWKENNPNILFKDLYFMLKIGENRYMKYKVKKTIFIR